MNNSNHNNDDDVIKKWIEKKSKITKFIFDLESILFMMFVFLGIIYLKSHPYSGKNIIPIFKISIIPIIILILLNSLWLSARVSTIFNFKSIKNENNTDNIWKSKRLKLRLIIITGSLIFGFTLNLISILWLN